MQVANTCDMCGEAVIATAVIIIHPCAVSILQKNESLEKLGDIFSIDVNSPSSPYYTAIELLPTLKKPPSDINEPGEFGHPFRIPLKTAIALSAVISQGYAQHGFNTIVSDIISPHRNLGDKREEECKVRCVSSQKPVTVKYSNKLKVHMQHPSLLHWSLVTHRSTEHINEFENTRRIAY